MSNLAEQRIFFLGGDQFRFAAFAGAVASFFR
jgi:hypothetical protein